MKTKLKFLLPLLLFLIIWKIPVAIATKKESPTTSKSGAKTLRPTVEDEDADVSQGVLWNSWYTITVNNRIHYAYFNEQVSYKGDRVHFQTRLWKQEEGYLNEEHLGAFAKRDDVLTPLFFNFYSTYRATETKIDGTVSDDGILTVKAVKGKTDLPAVKRKLPKNVIFSVFFPVWLRQMLPKMKVNQAIPFSTVLEDNLEMNFNVIPGRLYMERGDSYAVKTDTYKINVNYRDISATWWVKQSGMAMRVLMSNEKTLIEKVSQSEAESFLDKGTN